MFKMQLQKKITAEDLFNRYCDLLELKVHNKGEIEKRVITVPEVERPGLKLTGYLTGQAIDRLVVFGQIEIEYLNNLSQELRSLRLDAMLSEKIPAVIVTRNLEIPKALLDACMSLNIPLFGSSKVTMELISQLTVILSDELSVSMSCHGTLVEAFGVGLLIQGDSSVGKSEAALGLIERGHRLIADDVVKIKKRENSYLEGTGPELTRHLLEIRGIGIINVAHLYGAVCVSERERIDVIVKIEEWDDNHFYDRVGLEEKYCDILGVKVLYHILPVKPGRDVVLLLETMVLNHRLKKMGYHSAKEFNVKLLETISKKENEMRKALEVDSER